MMACNKRNRIWRTGLAGLMAAALLAESVNAGEALTEVGTDVITEAETETLTETQNASKDTAGESEPEEKKAAETAGKTGADMTEEEKESVLPQKDETVYVISDAAGTVQDVIVSDWIKNAEGSDSLADVTTLTDIENLEGDETFSDDGDGAITWQAGGNDIYYQGKTQEELPVTVSAAYQLDGEEMSPEEMAGKSGEVTIRYTFENKQQQEVEIDGVKSSLHTPFAVITGILLDEDALSGAKITNGRIISDGDLTIAVGIAFPGLSEDLKTPAYASLTKLVDAKIPDYVEITGTTEDFRWNTVYIMVTNEIFTASEADMSSAIDEIFGKLGSLKDGVGQIADGVSSLNTGAGQLKEGTQSLADGLATLTENNEALQDGASQIFDSALENVKEQLGEAGITVDDLTIDNYAATLGFLEKLAQGENKEKLTAAISQLDDLKTFCEGLKSYTDGVAEAKAGADQVNEGTASVQAGTAKLLLGTTILRAALPDLSGAPEALKQSVSLGEDYDTFTGLADGMDGKVRFIWKLAGI